MNLNLRTVPTVELCAMWFAKPAGRQADAIWDEVNRRTGGELIQAPKKLVWEAVKDDGVKIIRMLRPYDPAALDARFIESLPDEDNLAFEPSAELDRLSIYSR